MKPEAEREVLLFQAAAQLGAVERMQFLDLKCGDEKVLRRRVEALLAAHEGSRAFMVDLPDARATTRVDPGPIDDQPMEQTLGRYKIREKIGEGGCGVVYVAEQSVPIRRRVALKVIKLGMDTRQVVARFEAERQALALMDHPNIAKVLDAGATETGRPYFVMELVRGIRITDYCDENHLSTRDRLDLFVQVCNAIQHAHQKGIIHRDIKPSNILVTLHDGVPVPKVIDFGIAKATEARLTDSTLYTQLHQLLGTPAYMSPEQAEMSGLDVDTRSDIYSLGVLLYELLIGRTPFDAGKLIAAGVDAMRRTIRETEPLRPSTRLAALRGDDLTATAKRRRIDPPRLVYLIKGDLDWIVMRCLEKDRTRRYETANGLAMDIQRHLSDEPVVARPPSRTYRFVKTVRRNTGAFMAAGMVLAALVIGIVSSVSQTIRAKNAETRERTEAHRARRAEQIAEAERIRAERNLYAADMNIVQQALADANLRRARERLHAHETGGTQDLRGWEWYYLSGLARGDDVFSQRNTNSVVSILPLSLPNRVLIGWENGTLDLWDIAGRRSFAAAAQIEGGLRAAVIDASGEVIAAQSEGGTVGIWQLVPVGALKLLNSFHCPGTVRAISAARKLIAIVAEEEGRWEIADSDRGLIAIWNYETGQKLEVLPNSGAGAIFSTDGETLVTGSWRSSVQVWKTSDWSQQKTLRDVGRVLGMSMSPNGQWLLLNTGNGTFLCDLTRNAQPQLLDKISVRDTTFRSQFSRDGTRFAAAFGDGEIGLWDLSSQKGINRLRAHEGWVDALAFSEDGQSLVSADRTTKTLRVFKVEPRTNDETVISLYTPAIFSRDGRFMAVGDKIGNNFNSTVWDLATGQKKILPGTSNPLRFTENGATLITAMVETPLPVGIGSITGLKLWNIHSGTVKDTIYLSETNHHAGAVALSPDATTLAAGDELGNVLLWDAKSGTKMRPLVSQSGRVWNLVFSPNGKTLAVGIIGDVAVWDLEKRVRIFQQNALGSPLAFSPDSRTLAISTETEILLCNLATTTIDKLTGHRGRVYSLAFSPDGRTLASAAEDLKLWSLAAQREVASFRIGEPFLYVQFSTDGRHLIGGTIGKARIWTAAPGAFEAVASR